MEQGRIVNGLKRKTWIERYAKSGEFTLVANADVGIREKLPIGSFVSHVDTTEIMIVENHEVREDADKTSEIVVTGRGFETFFENRIVGSNKTFPTTDGSTEYLITADHLAEQIVTLIEEHVSATELLDSGNALPYVEILSELIGFGETVARSVKKGDLYSRVLELLEVGGLGIKVIRPGFWSPATASDHVAVIVHVGTNRSSEIVFSHDTGEIESSEYLWSNKKAKNAALISGRWVTTTVIGPETGINRRWMPVDASDLDNNLSAAPTGGALTSIVNAMQRRGMEALAAQGDVALTKAEVSKDTNKAAYRKDFDVGDLITVNGSFNETSVMRVSEYVEIEDETGGTGYPTLTVV